MPAKLRRATMAGRTEGPALGIKRESNAHN